MTITPEQFIKLAPSAKPATVAEYFALNVEGVHVIDRIMTEHGICETHVVAQFLAACHIASNGFTEFDQVDPQPPVPWLTGAAHDWFDTNSSEAAMEWRWSDVMDGEIIELYKLTNACWPECRLVLPMVCDALGIEDQSDVALKDRGASEM